MKTVKRAASRFERIKGFLPPSPTSAYRVRIADNDADVEAAQVLRFRVFNMELGEGLEESLDSGRDSDKFDSVCDHLLIEHVTSGEIIGTYRLQTGKRALGNLGYYSEQEFEFAPFESLRSEIIELGRACIAKDHRNMVVLGLLWKGIAQYCKLMNARYLIGCSSLTSVNPAEGWGALEKLRRYLAPDHLITHPTPEYVCPMVNEEELEFARRTVEVPRLMRAYLALGAKICGSPALDSDFKTIDYLTLLDLESLGPRAMQKFLG